MNLKYGYSYYPEHCSSYEEIDRDVELICVSGANVVRMGEFAWDSMEKTEGNYCFDVFLYTIRELGRRGVSTVFCTPTSCPPSWLMKKYPEISYVDYRGVKRPFGTRHHYCYNNEIYRSYSVKITQAIIDALGSEPYVIGFQIGNEFAQESSGRCHCPVCAEKFRSFLKERYGNIENFNRRCGTFFWGESFSSFDEVFPPTTSGEPDEQELIPSFYDNPGLRLNFEYFCSHSFCEYLELQADLLRKTGKPVTTNSTGFGTNLIDYYDFFKKLDLFGVDIYPSLSAPKQAETEFTYAFARSIKKRPFWLLEFAVGGGHGLWAKEGRLQPLPGAIELSAMHAFASGAQLVTHFQYKTFRFGAEQLNYALLDQDRVPRRRYHEFAQTAAALEKYSPLLEKTMNVTAKIAIVLDYKVLWSFKIKPINRDFSYVDFCSEFYDTLRSLGYDADIISPVADFVPYSLLIIPAPFVTDDRLVKKLRAYVLRGGTVLTTFLSSVKNTDNTAYDTSLPAGLTDIFGVTVSEVEPVFDCSRTDIRLTLPNKEMIGKNRYWLDELTPSTAETLGTIVGSYRDQKTVVTKNHFGSGIAYYLGTMLAPDSLAGLLQYICTKIGVVRHPFSCSERVSVVPRTDGIKVHYFVFNFHDTSEALTTKKPHISADGTISTEFILPPFGYTCLSEI